MKIPPFGRYDIELLLRRLNISNVMPDLIRHPGQFLIPAFAGMTALTYIVAGVITRFCEVEVYDGRPCVSSEDGPHDNHFHAKSELFSTLG